MITVKVEVNGNVIHKSEGANTASSYLLQLEQAKNAIQRAIDEEEHAKEFNDQEHGHLKVDDYDAAHSSGDGPIV